MIRLAIILSVLALAGCTVRAEDRKDLDAIDSAVAKIMCATTAETKESGITALASAVATFHPHSEEEDAESAVDTALLDFDAAACDRPDNQKPG